MLAFSQKDCQLFFAIRLFPHCSIGANLEPIWSQFGANLELFWPQSGLSLAIVLHCWEQLTEANRREIKTITNSGQKVTFSRKWSLNAFLICEWKQVKLHIILISTMVRIFLRWKFSKYLKHLEEWKFASERNVTVRNRDVVWSKKKNSKNFLTHNWYIFF